MVAWNAVSKQATAGHVGQHRLTASRAASDFGWCSGARSVSARELLPDARVDQDRPAEQVPAVHDPVPDRVHVPERLDRGLDRRRVVRAARRRQVGGAHHRVRVVEDAELEAAGPGVDDQDRGQYGHFQSRISGASSPCSRV